MFPQFSEAKQSGALGASIQFPFEAWFVKICFFNWSWVDHLSEKPANCERILVIPSKIRKYWITLLN